MTVETGRPLAESEAEVDYAASHLRWCAAEAERIRGEHGWSADGSFRLLTTRAAVGPCVLITPWNFPLLFADVLARSGVPDGVVNVLPTSAPEPVVRRLLLDGRARKLSFTGSTTVGRRLAAVAVGRVAIALASATPSGLAGYVFSGDVGRALALSDALECGMVGVNRGLLSDAAAPFGGIKESGLGREGGREGIGEYLDTRYTAVEAPAPL